MYAIYQACVCERVQFEFTTVDLYVHAIHYVYYSSVKRFELPQMSIHVIILLRIQYNIE